MEYRAVGNLCAVRLGSLNLPISEKEAWTILETKGFRKVNVDLICLARSCIGFAGYRRGACVTEAPRVFDCSGFVRWLYGQRGIWLPRRSIQQSEKGLAIGLDKLESGDAIFTSGPTNYYRDSEGEGVGHVGIATGSGTVIHATHNENGVIEISLKNFLQGRTFRVARRYVQHKEEVLTVKIPPNQLIETDDDIGWIVWQSFMKQ